MTKYLPYLTLGLICGFFMVLLLPLILIAWFIIVSPKPILCDGGEGMTTPPLSTDEAWIDNVIERVFGNRKDTGAK